MTAATIRMMIIGSASSFKNRFRRESFFPSSSRFLPYCASLFSASWELKPPSEEFCSFNTSSTLSRYSFTFPPVRAFPTPRFLLSCGCPCPKCPGSRTVSFIISFIAYFVQHPLPYPGGGRRFFFPFLISLPFSFPLTASQTAR